MKKYFILTITITFIIHQSFADWVISSGTKVKVPAGKHLKVDGNLNMKSTAQLTNQGTFSLTGNFDNQGESVLGTGIFKFYGSSTQQFTGGAEFGDVIVESGSSLEIQPGAWVTIGGTTTNMNSTNGIIVKSDLSGSGSLIHNATLVQGTVQEYLTSEQWHLVSPPITDAEIGSYFDIYLTNWDEATATWAYLVDPLTMPMEEGEGFGAWATEQYTGSTAIDFAGILNVSDIPLSLDYTLASTQTGWNLIGNPFSASLDWNDSWALNDVGGWAVVYDDGVDRGWNPYLPPGSQSYNGKTDGIIPITQGFWVRATDAGANMTIPATERTHNNQLFYKEGQEVSVPTLRLAVEGNENSNEAVVIMMQDATTGFDGLYDLEKFNNESGVPKLFSLMDESELCVNVLPEDFVDNSEPSVDMGFGLGMDGQCKISASGMESFEPDIPIYLEDLKENQMIDLRIHQDYIFTTTPLDDVHRFILHFADPLDVDEILETNQIQAYGADGKVYISINNELTGIAKVYDVMGREAGMLNLDGSSSLYSLPVERNVYYVVRVVCKEEVFNQKVYVY